YTWNIAKEASLLLQGNGHSINEVDAYEDLGLSSVLACEERHYRWIINRDGSTTSIALTNGAQKILATSVSQWATALPTNELFEQAETTLQQITDAATVVFQLSPNQKKVSFVLQNAQGKTLARSAAFYPLLPGELESGNYSLAQADVDFVLAATENDFYFLVDEEAQEFCGFLQQSDSRIILYTEDHYSYFNALSDSLAVLLPERTEIMEYFLKECRLEGMYVVEHILLRPDKEDADPSSFMPVCIDPNGAYCRPL